MNRTAAFITATLLAVLAAGAQEHGMDTTTITFAAQAHPHAVYGFGGEWDPHFWREPNTKRGCDEAEWAKVTARIRDLGVNRARMMVLPDWYEPENDNNDPAVTDASAFTWDSEPMRSLCRHLDFCREADIRVTLTWWCAPVKRHTDGAAYWLAFPDVKQWCAAPNDVDECAENVTALLQYLLVYRGYDCIDAFTFVNEPDWTFFNNDNEVVFEYYAENCRAIDARLRAAGLRDRLTLDLADASMHRGWLKQSVEALQGVADHYNSHSYVFSCEDDDYPAAIRKWIGERVRTCGDSPFSTNELGTRHYSGAYSVTDLESFERAFLVAQYALLGLNEGMTGALFWGLYDQHYYDGDPDDGSNGGKMTTNLMAYVDEGWRLRRTGQAWRLVCRAAPRDSRIHPGTSTDGDVDGVALKTPAGGVNVLLVNRAKQDREVRLEGLPMDSVPGAATDSLFTRDHAPEASPAHGLTVRLPAESVLLRSY